MPLAIQRHAIDIELTNRCNATCSYCPRDRTPSQGFMAPDVFRQALGRALEAGAQDATYLTGLGEPMLHPQFVEYVRIMAEMGISPAFTTNASRLFKGVSQRLLDAGLKTITFSVSDMGDSYRKVYNLDFDNTLRNILDFLALNQGRCKTVVNIVPHEGNRGQVEDMRRYWQSLGIDHILSLKEINRGGACSKKYKFQESDRHKPEARAMLHQAGMSELCFLPFYSVFIGWNGQYYLCCMDWEKTMPLGSVFDFSVRHMDDLKLQYLKRAPLLCGNCSADPVNVIAETMHEMEAGQKGRLAARHVIKAMKESQQGEFSRALETWDAAAGAVIVSDATRHA